MRLVTPLALSACALAALSACTPAARPVAAPPSAPPAASGAGAAPTASTGSRPAAPKSAAPKPDAPAAAKPAGTVAAKPAAARPSWKDVDFEKAAYADLGRCVRTPELPDTAEISAVRYADLTGDGVTEAVVAAACRTTTASNPISVFLYDGKDRRAPLRRLGAIGTSQYLVSAELRTKGRTVTVTSRALSDGAPRCCPDLRITQTYEWSGGELRRTAIDEVPLDRE